MVVSNSAVVMTYLVIGAVGLNWVMADVKRRQLYGNEATGYQFAWHLRYPALMVYWVLGFKMINTPDNP
jgi:hypothetical protein